jgi:hypothetical protein
MMVERFARSAGISRAERVQKDFMLADKIANRISFFGMKGEKQQ